MATTDTETKLGDGGLLTPGEQAYLNSGGADAAALEAENEPKPETPAPAVDAPKPDAKPVDGAPPPAAPVAATPEPEPGEEEIAAPDGKTKRRVVDSRALKSEREKRHAVEAELAKERETRTRIDERFKILNEAISRPEPAAAPQPEEIPDPEKDIFGYANYLGKELAALKEARGQDKEQTEEERAAIRTISTYQQESARFAAKIPDFKAPREIAETDPDKARDYAYDYLFQVRRRQLEMQGYAPHEVDHWLYVEEMNLVDRAMKAGRSPAQQIYEIAKTMGYAPKPPAAAPAPAVPAAANGHAAGTNGRAAPAPPLGALAPPTESVTAEIDRIRNGQAAARSLSNGGGGGVPAFTLESLVNMSDGEFTRMFTDPVKREQAEKILQGG